MYGALLTALIVAFAASLALRRPVALDVIRDRNVLFRTLDDGRVENVYDVKILNKTERGASLYGRRPGPRCAGHGSRSSELRSSGWRGVSRRDPCTASRVRAVGLREHSVRGPRRRCACAACGLERPIHRAGEVSQIMFAKPINGGLWLVIGLPLFAILASLHVTFVAFTRGDATLPDEYHWEGMQLDRDFASAQRAAALDVRATLRLLSATGDCQVTLWLGRGSSTGYRAESGARNATGVGSQGAIGTIRPVLHG